MDTIEQAEQSPKSSIRERVAGISASDWMLWGLVACFAFYAVLLACMPWWVNSAHGVLGFPYSIMMNFAPFVMLFIPSRDGRSLTWAILAFLVVLMFQWRVGFGFFTLDEMYLVRGAIGFVLVLAKRGAEINLRSASSGFAALILLTMVMGIDLHSKVLRASGQNLATKHSGLNQTPDYYTSLDYADVKFSVLDLRNSDVRGAKFLRSDLTGTFVDLENANLAGAAFVDSSIKSNALQNADLTGARFEGESCKSFDLAFIGQAKVTKTRFTCSHPPKLYRDTGDANLDEVMLSLAFPVHELSIRAKSARKLRLDYISVRHLHFWVEDAEGAWFLQAELPNASFSRSELDPKTGETHLAPINLRRAIFTSAVLRNASFHNVDLRDAQFTGTDLRGASFVNCNVAGANFMGANLGKATPEETKFLNTPTTGVLGH